MLELFEALTVDLAARRGFKGLIEAWWRCGVDLTRPLPSEPNWTLRPAVPVEPDHTKWETMKTTGLWGDLNFALRALMRAPGFTAITIGTLAVGIGATTAVYSVVNGIILRPLTHDHPESLVAVWPEMITNVRTTEWLGENIRSLSLISGVSVVDFALAGEGEPERVLGARVSPTHFDVLGDRPLLGRTFLPEESEPGKSSVVVLSHALWQTRYGGDPEILGRSIRVDFQPFTVIGVVRQDHRPILAGTRLWVPQTVEFGTTVGTDGTWWISTRIARLGPGASVETAQRELQEAVARLGERYPADIAPALATRATITTLHDAVVGSFGQTLWILLGAVAFVLVIACANVANLLLARSDSRQSEIAVRMALGASRARVLFHLLTESVVLGVLGGAAGLVLAWGTLHVLVANAPPAIPRIQEVSVDIRVLLFAASVSLMTPLIFGSVPAYRSSRTGIREVLSTGGGRGLKTRGRGPLMASLIVVQVAVSIVLGIGAGLMVRTVRNQMAVDPGFGSEGVLTMKVAIPSILTGADGVSAPNRPAYRQLWDDVAALPGVQSVGGIHILPLTEGNNRYPF